MVLMIGISIRRLRRSSVWMFNVKHSDWSQCSMSKIQPGLNIRCQTFRPDWMFDTEHSGTFYFSNQPWGHLMFYRAFSPDWMFRTEHYCIPSAILSPRAFNIYSAGRFRFFVESTLPLAFHHACNHEGVGIGRIPTSFTDAQISTIEIIDFCTKP